MFDYARVVRRAFENVGPRNPLKKLSNADKRLLVALLDVYLLASERDETSNLLEEAAAIVSEAGALGCRMRAQILDGPLAEILTPFLHAFRDLPGRLEGFSIQMGAVIDSVAGKRGHKGKTGKSQFLIMASEFVRLKTGKHYDEHLAELLQAIDPNTDITGQRDTSGDSIRKKREHLRKTYPLIYYSTLNRVRSFKSKMMDDPGVPL